MSSQAFGCTRCGAPLAPSTRRCPNCLTYVGFADPSPFNARWWMLYAAVLVFLFVIVGLAAAASA